MQSIQIKNKDIFNKIPRIYNLIFDFPLIYFPDEDWKIITSDTKYHNCAVYAIAVNFHKIIKYKNKNIFYLDETHYRWGNSEYNLKYYISLPLPQELIPIIQLFLGNHRDIILS
jgi:hypothetical protein